MIKTLAKQIKEFKAASIATPLFMILEVLMEMIIPFLMASIIDKGVNAGDIQHIYRHQELYSDTVARLAYETGTPLIGVREMFLGEKRLPGLISADGIHLTMDGYTKPFDTLAGWLRGAVI